MTVHPYLWLLLYLLLCSCVCIPPGKVANAPQPEWMEDQGRLFYVEDHKVVAKVLHDPVSESIWRIEGPSFPEVPHFDSRQKAKQFVTICCADHHCLSR